MKQDQFDEMGQLKNGVFEEHCKNGSLSCVGSYVDGEKDGEWKTYHEDGTLDKTKVYKSKAS